MIEHFRYVNDLRDRFFPAYSSLSTEQLDWKTEGYKNTIGFLLRHIAQSEDWFIQAVVLKKEMIPKRKSELATIESILDYLNETRAKTLKFLEENPVEILTETRTIPEGYRAEPIDNPTIGWIIHRIFDHEVYHLAQVNLLLRLQGIDPPSM